MSSQDEDQATVLSPNPPGNCQIKPFEEEPVLSFRQFQRPASVMIEKFATLRGMVSSEFLDLNHTSKSMILVSLLIPKFARDTSTEVWRTSESGH